MWFNVDDQLATGEDITRIEKRYRLPAIGLFTIVGSWLSSHLNDDLWVPLERVKELGGTPHLIGVLVDADFWTRAVRDGRAGVAYTLRGCRVGSLQAADKSRAATAERVRRHREKRAQQAQQGDDQQESGDVTPLQPVTVTEDCNTGNADVARYAGTNTNTNTNTKVVTKAATVTSAVPAARERAVDRQGRAQMSLTVLAGGEDRPPDVPPSDREARIEPASRSAAADLVRECVDRNLPSATLTGLRLAVGEMLGQGIPCDVMREALADWGSKTGIGPGVLPSLVSDVMKRRNGSARPRQSARDAKVSGWLERGET